MNAESVYSKAWNHFEMIAKQRLMTYNFYLLILGGLFVASFSYDPKKSPEYALWLLAACNMGAPIAFCVIDRRICRLLNNLKSILLDIETWDEWNQKFRPFHKDQETEKVSMGSYSSVFNLIFILHFLFGIFLFCQAAKNTHAANNQKEININVIFKLW